jgi:glycosyltransferase involved in cell wall biosynthesis
MNLLRRIDSQRFQVDVLTHGTVYSSDPFISEIDSLGCQILSCPDPRQNLLQPWRYVQSFKQALRQQEAYDIIHSHTPPLDGAILFLAKRAGIKTRVVYSHTGNVVPKVGLSWHSRTIRTFYYALSQYWIAQNATVGLACSQSAATYMFGKNWEKDPRWQVLHCGIDLATFQTKANSTATTKSEFGIPPNAFVVGHVGRFSEEKNHSFFVEIAAEIVKREADVYFLLIGDGNLRHEVEQKVSQFGITNHFIFAGSRSDVPRLMLDAMDVFLLPSLYEGLGLVLVEAQAAGLPCVLSDSIPEEADIVDSLMHRLSLSQPVTDWANVIMAERHTKSQTSQDHAFSKIRISSFNIENSSKKLIEIYEANKSKTP